MKTLTSDEIRALPEYRELLHKRRQITIPLCLTMLVTYYGFILMVAYSPATLAQKTSDGVTSVGIWVGLGLIFITFAITAFNVWYVNRHITDLVSRIQAKAVTK